MRENKLKGIILRKINYSENDIIFDVLSEEGKIAGFFARGARRLKSRFSGVLQLGFVVDIVYGTGKNLNYPKEISVDRHHLFSFYSRSLEAMNFYIDVLTITKAVSKDLADEELFTLVLSAYHDAENGKDLISVYDSFLDGVLNLIGIETKLRCSLSGELISEPDFFYLAQSNKIFSLKNKPKSIDAEHISFDPVFQKNYLQKLIYEHVSNRMKLKF